MVVVAVAVVVVVEVVEEQEEEEEDEEEEEEIRKNLCFLFLPKILTNLQQLYTVQLILRYNCRSYGSIVGWVDCFCCSYQPWM